LVCADGAGTTGTLPAGFFLGAATFFAGAFFDTVVSTASAFGAVEVFFLVAGVGAAAGVVAFFAAVAFFVGVAVFFAGATSTTGAEVCLGLLIFAPVFLTGAAAMGVGATSACSADAALSSAVVFFCSRSFFRCRKGFWGSRFFRGCHSVLLDQVAKSTSCNLIGMK